MAMFCPIDLGIESLIYPYNLLFSLIDRFEQFCYDADLRGSWQGSTVPMKPLMNDNHS